MVEPKPRTRRLWPALLAGLLLLMAVLHTGAWWIATGRMLDSLPTVVANAAQAGWRIEGGQPERAGWPWAAALRVPTVTIARQLGGTTLQWTAATLRITLSPLAPSILTVSAEGAQTLSTAPDNPIPIHTSTALLHIALYGGPALLELTDLTIPGPVAFAARRISGSIQPRAAELTADGVTLSPALATPFDGPLAVSVGVNTNLSFPDAASPGASAAAWQAAKGRVTVPSMLLQWGPLRMTGSGAGGLDLQLQPEAQARLQVEGASQVVDALAHAGLVAPGPASAIRAVLSLLSLAAKGGPVPLPITLADRTLTIAQFPLVKLPLLDWNLP